MEERVHFDTHTIATIAILYLLFRVFFSFSITLFAYHLPLEAERLLQIRRGQYLTQIHLYRRVDMTSLEKVLLGLIWASESMLASSLVSPLLVVEEEVLIQKIVFLFFESSLSTLFLSPLGFFVVFVLSLASEYS